MPGPGLAGRQAEPFCRSGTGGSNPVRSSGQSRLSREFAFLGREAGGFPVVNMIGIVWVAKILTDLTPNDMARASSGISVIESRIGGRARQIENPLAPYEHRRRATCCRCRRSSGSGCWRAIGVRPAAGLWRLRLAPAHVELRPPPRRRTAIDPEMQAIRRQEGPHSSTTGSQKSNTR